MPGYTKEVKQRLSNGGCYFDRQGKGDHEIWFCPGTNRHVAVDGNIKSRWTANGILKDAGCPKI